MAVVVAPQHADIWPRPARSGPIGPAAVILHVKPPGRVGVAGDLVHALTELWVRIRREAGADTLIRRLERLTTVLAQIMAARRDAEVHAVPVTNDRVHAKAAGTRLPLARVLVI